MPLATDDDVQVHLPDDKILVANIDNYEDLQIDAERIIKGYLSGVYSPTTLAGWTDPSLSLSTSPGYVPELIRAIAGRFIAAFTYRRYYSEDSLDNPQYAQTKYDEAMEMLRGVVSGAVTLIDEDEVVDTGGRLTSADFWPNDSTGEPKFTMDIQF